MRNREGQGKHRAPQARTNDQGVSLMEMVVAMGLFTLLGTLLCSVAILGMRVSSGLENRLDNAKQGSIALDAATKTLRTAVLPEQLTDQTCTGCTQTALVQANRSQVSFYANLNNTGQGPSLVTLRVVEDIYSSSTTGRLLLTTQPPTVLGPGQYTFCAPGTVGCVVQQRVLARGLDWPAQDIFTYYNNDGEPINANVLGSTDLAAVTSIDLMFNVQTLRGSTNYPASIAATRVRLPNADINIFTQAN